MGCVTYILRGCRGLIVWLPIWELWFSWRLNWVDRRSPILSKATNEDWNWLLDCGDAQNNNTSSVPLHSPPETLTSPSRHTIHIWITFNTPNLPIPTPSYRVRLSGIEIHQESTWRREMHQDRRCFDYWASELWVNPYGCYANEYINTVTRY